jgi:uncharacterized protein with GYD domain
MLWTQGQHDMVVVLEAPDDATVGALMLNIAKHGNIRGLTLRAFTATEMEKIVEKVT